MGKNLNYTLSTIHKFPLAFLRFPDSAVVVLLALQATLTFPKTSTITSLRLSRKTLSFLHIPPSCFQLLICSIHTKNWMKCYFCLHYYHYYYYRYHYHHCYGCLTTINTTIITVFLSTIHLCVYYVSGTGFSPYQQQSIYSNLHNNPMSRYYYPYFILKELNKTQNYITVTERCNTCSDKIKACFYSCVNTSYLSLVSKYLMNIEV